MAAAREKQEAPSDRRPFIGCKQVFEKKKNKTTPNEFMENSSVVNGSVRILPLESKYAE